MVELSVGPADSESMVLRCLAFLLMASAAWGEERFRISKVVPGEGAGIARFEIAPKKDQKPEVIFVANDPIVTSADVESAWVDPVSEEAISVELRDGGEKKIGAATANLAGNLRLAVIVDGRVLMAPVVRGPLGKNFQISGLQDLTEDELWSYALMIEGKSADEVKAGVKEMRKNREALAKIPPVEREYYTDEEYAQLKAAREKAGIHFLDEVPTKESLNKNLRKGMTEDEVIGVYGKPRWHKKGEQGETIYYGYELANEKRPHEKTMRMESFEVHFTDGKVVRWNSHRWSDNLPESKRQNEREDPARATRLQEPAYDPSDPDLDYVMFLEETKVVGRPRDLPLEEASQVMSLLYSLSQHPDPEDRAIKRDCDVMVALGADFPEIEKLRKQANGSGVPLKELHVALKPYCEGDKPYPESLLKKKD